MVACFCCHIQIHLYNYTIYMNILLSFNDLFKRYGLFYLFDTKYDSMSTQVLYLIVKFWCLELLSHFCLKLIQCLNSSVVKLQVNFLNIFQVVGLSPTQGQPFWPLFGQKLAAVSSILHIGNSNYSFKVWTRSKGFPALG